MSVGNTGQQGNGFSSSPAISSDHRYVAFSSTAPNLVAGDVNGRSDIFVRDVVAGTTTLVSLADDGAQANSDSFLPDISDDGRYVAFTSWSTNLVPTGGPFASGAHIYVRDRLLGTTQQVDLSATPGVGSSNGGGCCPSISSGGGVVAFESVATDIVMPDINWVDVYVRDLAAAATMRASTDSSGNQVPSPIPFGVSSFGPDLSGDGSLVAFSSSAPLVPDDTNGTTDVYVKDIATGAVVRASVDSDEDERTMSSGGAEISGDGDLVLFTTRGDFVADDGNGFADAYVRDLSAGTTRRVSVASGGGDANFHSSGQDISPDGRYVVVQSDATNLVSGDTNGAADIVVYDLQSASARRASVSDGGAEASGASFEGVVADSGAAAFGSSAANLVDGDTNGTNDIFLNIANAAPACGGLTVTPARLWPPNHGLVSIAVGGITDADGDELTFSYAVTQDEPVNGSGDGDTGPDAAVVDGSLQLRAERSGAGDGRVYTVVVTASDGQASCSGTATVSVPHSAKSVAVASPASFNSFGT